MTYNNAWVSVKDHLPEVPKGKHAVEVIIVVIELDGEHIVSHSMFSKDKGNFEELWYRPDGKYEWHLLSHEITHWMYMPELPRI